ncbi:hypothetical protein [Sphingobacterium pedocola]|uniref:Uncharacterized protein n=1 Tax=Sphingobacterium pedocola TaxID=2082722 RepID=A0ABR9T405_9SPHI|nr:hypothetical protein [Sphingobacterium pedocola]MBE8719392.1 hypothetical protein [Sphingobacterium pedocola]
MLITIGIDNSDNIFYQIGARISVVSNPAAHFAQSDIVWPKTAAEAEERDEWPFRGLSHLSVRW